MEREQRNDSDMEQTGERRYFAKPKICQFCADKNLAIDYKQGEVLRRFVTEEGKIRPRRQALSFEVYYLGVAPLLIDQVTMTRAAE